MPKPLLVGEAGGGHDLGGGRPWTQDLEILGIPPANNNRLFQAEVGRLSRLPLPPAVPLAQTSMGGASRLHER